jgi:hypothetical protein
MAFAIQLKNYRHSNSARFVKRPSPGLGGGHNQSNFIAPLDFCDYFRST